MLSTTPDQAVAPILVIGIGNPSRGDDAIGPLAIDRLESVGLPGVELLTDFQLQVEHALDLLGRREVVFIDATVAGEAAFSFESITPAAEQGATTHGFSPAAVLDVFRRYTDAPLPDARVLAVRGFGFDLGAPLTAAAVRNLDAALEMLVSHLTRNPEATMPELLPLRDAVAELERGLPPRRDAGFLGARVDPSEAALVLIPVPWEATTSYGGGTRQAPAAIIRASHQLDLEDRAFGAPYRAGIAFAPPDPALSDLDARARPAALEVIAALERGATAPAALALVNAAGAEVNASVHAAASAALGQGRLVGVVGGDHSSPYGLLQALAGRHPDGFGVLHLDAHHDLRAAYEGFTWSHASIFFNVMERLAAVRRLVQVAIRDYSGAERRYAEGLGRRGACFYGGELFRLKAEGVPFRAVCERIIEALPEKVYVSFDIDGLDPSCCPSTGTPVPGGLSFDEAAYLLEVLAASGRRVIGFDLCEVAPSADGDEWDANVGARVLYKLCGCCLRSQGLC